jgi:ferredoxin
MEQEVTITIDGKAVRAAEGSSILRAADGAGIYIPRLCYHPDLPSCIGMKAERRVYCGETVDADTASTDGDYKGCDLCMVEIEGRGRVRACTEPVAEGMAVRTDSPEVKELRRAKLTRMVANHPHACLFCAEREGCDREECTMGVERDERCCAKFDNCEFQALSEFVTVRGDVSKYRYRNFPAVETPFFSVDNNLCVGCARCIRACEKTSGKKVIGFVFHNGDFIVGTLGPTYKDSGCIYCGACVAVCPTGAIMDKGLPWPKKEKLRFSAPVLPPELYFEFTMENVGKVPAESGVYELFDERHAVIHIKGVPDLRADLQEKLQSAGRARYFRYEEHGMYTMRETEMLERYLKQHNTLPEVNNEIEDLY